MRKWLETCWNKLDIIGWVRIGIHFLRTNKRKYLRKIPSLNKFMIYINLTRNYANLFWGN